MTLSINESAALRYLVYLALMLFIVIGLKMTSYMVTVLVISVIMTMLALPTVMKLRKRGIPDIVSVSLITGIALLFIVLLIGLTLFSFNVLVQDLPLYQEELNVRLSGISGLLGQYGLSLGDLSASFNLQSIIQVVLSSVLSVGDAVMYIFFIGVTTFFMLLEAPRIAPRVESIFGKGSEKLEQVSRMSRYMIEFVIVRTETNLVHGVVFGGVLWAMGVHAAVLWGILTFVLNYIPYIGLVIAAIPAIFFAWLQFGIWGALGVVALVCFLNLIVENPVFSFFASRKFEIPALIVIISVIFWGWLLGIAGMAFAVPLTIIVLILIECSDEISWINTIMGADRIFDEPEK